MSLLVLLDLFATGVYLFLAVYILTVNPKALVNRICSGFLFCFGLYGFTMVFVHNPHSSKEATLLVTNITAAGWLSFGSFFLWFMLAFTGKKKILKKKWLYLILFGIPLVFIYKQWTNFLYIDFAKVYYGWRPVLSPSYWTFLFFFYTLAFMGIGLYINIDFIRKTRNPIMRKQAKINFACIVIVLFFGTLTDIVFVVAEIDVIPNIGSTTMLIWAVGVVYAMVKYRFLTITPTTAAENIIATMYDCLILLDPAGNIVTVNKAVLNLLGYKEKELRNLPLGALLTDQELKTGLDKTIIAEGDVKNRDLRFKTKAGNQINVLFSGSTLRDEKGNAAGMVCIAKDISERKKLEAERLKSKKLESIGILAGGIAHDFNNLLSVILGSITMVKEKVPARTLEYRLLNKAEEASIKAADLAAKFITFSPGGWVKKEPITAARLADIARNLKEKGLPLPPGENISIHIAMPGNLSTFHADEKQLEQVLKSLFLNALDAVAEGGKITLHRLDIMLDADNKFLLKEGQYVVLVIRDNGCGIPPDNLEKIFLPYFSTKSNVSQKGLGLGLTTCYAIVKKHDGHITVESKEGEGTTVTIYLPVSLS